MEDKGQRENRNVYKPRKRTGNPRFEVPREFREILNFRPGKPARELARRRGKLSETMGIRRRWQESGKQEDIGRGTPWQGRRLFGGGKVAKVGKSPGQSDERVR